MIESFGGFAIQCGAQEYIESLPFDSQIGNLKPAKPNERDTLPYLD